MDGVTEQPTLATAEFQSISLDPVELRAICAAAFKIAATDSDPDDDYADEGRWTDYDDDPHTYDQEDYNPFDEHDTGDHDFGPDWVGYDDGTPLFYSTSSPACRAARWAQRFDSDPQRTATTIAVGAAPSILPHNWTAALFPQEPWPTSGSSSAAPPQRCPSPSTKPASKQSSKSRPAPTAASPPSTRSPRSPTPTANARQVGPQTNRLPKLAK